MLQLSLANLVLILALTASPARAAAGGARIETPTAREILQRMGSAYTNCATYRDAGAVKTVFIEPGKRWTTEKPFSTVFIRPDRFRYEFKETGEEATTRYIIWAKDKDVRTWWDVAPGIGKTKPLGLAIAGATGVSGGSAHTVPAMLLPDEIRGIRLYQLKDAKRIEDAKVGKFDCFRVQGEEADTKATLWIDKGTFLLRMIYEEHQCDTFRTETTTTYHPMINGPIDDKLLAFSPPQAK
jgi:outer membrane lipoprotein-sorting protein